MKVQDNSTDFKLQERVKELKCLYELSRIAWEKENNLNAIIDKTLEILPIAMQFPSVAEAFISVGKKSYSTSGFGDCKHTISSVLAIGSENYGSIKVGYREDGEVSLGNSPFLNEERKLIKMVATELSLYINRAYIEEDRKKLQLQLQHSERLAFVGELTAGIAHELNEPLGRILGFSQLIKKSGGLSFQQDDDLERIIKASLYTREIIKKLMIFSRQMPQQLDLVDINEIVANTIYFIDIRFQDQQVKVEQRLDPKLPRIQADPVQMSQVLVNLITNAFYALPKGGKVTVSTRQKNNQVSLIVKDNGIGMTASVKKKIFEPFFTTKPPGEGTGLGLSVVQGIVESHRGRITVRSTSGSGSRFEVLLPVKIEEDI
ncbi:MAG: GHKL domain-containing protein [Cyclobacteriaceae bacterium]|nr:GHKL domain-containing protein [Cyclobacteriaceae bacterium SS2]